jgi:hypothetical protein
MNARHQRSYIAHGMSFDTWVHWELKRWTLENETPGKFGYFASGEVTK